MKGFILPTKLLVKPLVVKDKVTKAGILVPGTVRSPDPCTAGEVVLCGEGTPQIPMCVKVGQTILFPPRGFQQVRILDEDFMLVDLRDVLYYY